jgi:hypothetical protein
VTTLFFHLSWKKVALLEGCVAIVHEMEAHTEHFNQHANMNFFTANGISPTEIHC